jgi:AcrR family transcriptional regulator
LLDAAVRVFSQRGYARATTREIAETAGVAEGTIYRHFADKQELFRSALAAAGPTALDEFVELTGLAGQGTIRDNLARFITALEDIERDLAPLQASMWSDAELTERLASSRQPDVGGPGLALGPLAAYLLAEQRLGRIRRDVDCERAAFALFAVPFASVVMGRMSPGEIGARGSDLMETIDVILNGLLP